RLEGVHHPQRQPRHHQRHRVGKLEVARHDRHRRRDGEEQHEAQLEVHRPTNFEVKAYYLTAMPGGTDTAAWKGGRGAGLAPGIGAWREDGALLPGHERLVLLERPL